MMDPQVSEELAEPRQTKLQRTLLDFGTRRLEAAERRWTQRHPNFREAEQLYRAFRVPDEQDQLTRNDNLTQGVEKIVVPYSYAIMQSMLAFLMATLTQRKPIIPVEGKGPRDVRAAYLMEALLDSQCQDMTPSYKLVLYQWFLDTFRYGVGIVKGLWTIDEFPEFFRTASPIIDPMTGQTMGYHESMQERDIVAYEGNRLMNVVPYEFFPDPRRSYADFQRGEFVAHRTRVSRLELRQREAEGLYVGIDDIPKMAQPTSYGSGFGVSQSDLSRIMNMNDPDNEAIDAQGEPFVDLDEMWAFCEPGPLGLPPSSSRTPRLWVFTYANRARCIRAEPANLPASKFPYDVIEVNYDWHSPANFGMIETFKGLQYYYSWLFNSRMQAVRKTLNNEMVVDPGMVEEMDLLDPEPGRLIRLKREIWGDGRAREAVFPIPVQDVTQGHLNDAKVVQDLIQTITGASNVIMGMPNPGRRAATEVQGQMKLAAGRMQMILEIIVDQGMKPQARQMAKNTQAFLDLSQPLALREPWKSLLGMPYVQLTPDVLSGEFQFPFTDGGIPTDKQMEAGVWKELIMAGMQANPQMMAQMPWTAILARWLRAMNIRDLQSFGLTPINLTVQPDEQVQAQQQQGNLTPTQEPQTRVPSDQFAMPPHESVPGVGANGMGTNG